MATRRPHILPLTALVAVVGLLAGCTPRVPDTEVVDRFTPASPEVQDVTIEYGGPVRPEALTLCESPGTFIPFEKPVERQVYDVLTAYKTGLNETLERLTAKVIVAESARYGLDPWFVVGVIRVESRFNNFAVSNKDARGLMQVRPFVGEEVAADLGVNWTGGDSLFNPIKNVKIGVAYLAILNQSFKGDKDKVLAGYNMGPNRVREWLRDGRDLPTGYSSLVQEYQVLLGNIGTHTIAGTDLVGRITMIERNLAKKNAVIATVAEIPETESDVLGEVPNSSLPVEPAFESLDVPAGAATDGGLADALIAEEAQTVAAQPEPAIEKAHDPAAAESN
jgi:hypothetical protein